MAKTTKHPADPFDTFCWQGKVITDPYQVFASLFAEAPVHYFRKLIKRLVSHAAKAGIYKKETPADVLLFMKLIRSLIKTANMLKQKDHCPLIINKEELFNKKYYRSHYVTTDAWAEFPRLLSKKEYCNPYLVFKKFFRYNPLPHWVQCWEQVVEGAFCKEEAFAPAAGLKIYRYLVKLVEAAHLIDVREVMHVAGCLKNRNNGG